jgi:hypothetical protein
MSSVPPNKEFTPEERLNIIRQPRRAHSVSVALRVEEERTLEDIANEMNPKWHDIRDRQKGRR